MLKIAKAIGVWSLRIAGYFVLTVCAVIALLGVLRIGVDLQYYAQFFLEFFGPIILVILVIGTALAWIRLRRGRHIFAVSVAVITTTAALACGFTLLGYVTVARAHGISIELLRALWPQSMHAGGPPQSFVYDRYHNEEQKLYIYRGDHAQYPSLRPVLVYIHGGGWVSGAAQDRQTDLSWFADRGYFVIGVDYPLSSANRHLWDVVQSQLGCALAWTARNVSRFNGDPGRIALLGDSAGGNLVLNLAYLAHNGRLTSGCGGALPQIQATVAVYPAVDLSALYAYTPARQFPLAYIGGSPLEYPERYRALSPITDAAGAAPPTLLLYGEDDGLVPVRDTERYVEGSRAAGNEVETIGIPRAGHGFDLVPGSIPNQIFRRSVVTFLRAHGLKP
jgi:acetyl esterase/lipase